MAIVQISKIIHRTGSNADLPQLDIGEIGFATDEQRVYIGNDPNIVPPAFVGGTTQTEILTTASPIDFSQINGASNSSLNITSPVNGQLIGVNVVGSTTTLKNVGANAGGLIDLGNVANVKIAGGVNGYVLQTDGAGNLSWTAQTGNGGGNGSPDGSNTQVQFNNAGSFGASPNFTFDQSLNIMTVGGNIVADYYFGNTSGYFDGRIGFNTPNIGNFTSINANYNIFAGGNIIANGNITSNTNIHADWFVGNFVGNVSGNLVVIGNNTAVLFNNDGNAGAADGFTFDYSDNTVSITGNLIANIVNANLSSIDGSVYANYITANSSLFLNTSGSLGLQYESDPTPNLYTWYITANSEGIYAGGGGNFIVPGTLYSIANRDGNVNGQNVNASYGNFGGIDTDYLNVNNGGNVFANNYFATSNVSANYFIGDGSQLTGLPATYANSNVSDYLPTYTGNISAGNITLTGNISANYILGDGSLLTGLPATYGNSNVADYLPTYTGNFSEMNIAGNLLPVANITYDLGNSTNRFKDLWLSGNTIYLGDANITVDSNGNVSLGNITFNSNGTINGSNVIGAVASATTAGTVTTNAQRNITSIGTLSSLAINNGFITMSGSGAGILALSGAITASTLGGSLTSKNQPNITSIGTLTSLTVSGNIVSGNANLGNALTANFVSGTLTTSAQPNITSLGTLSSINAAISSNVTGNILFYNTGTNAITYGSTITTAPVANNSTGITGQIAYDTSYIYICVATDTWIRAARDSW